MNTRSKFKIEKELLDQESVKNFLVSRPDLIIEGLMKISSDTIRIFYNEKIEGRKELNLTSELLPYINV